MLAEGVQKLAAKSADAGTVGQPQHRTLVAYALQDMEKSSARTGSRSRAR